MGVKTKIGYYKLVFLTTQCFSLRKGGRQTEDIWQTDVTLQKKSFEPSRRKLIPAPISYDPTEGKIGDG